VVSLGGAAAVAEPLVGEHRVAIQTQGELRAAGQVRDGGQVVRGTSRHQTVLEVVRQAERDSEAGFRFPDFSPLERHGPEEILGPHPAVGIAPRTELLERGSGQAPGAVQIALAHGASGLLEEAARVGEGRCHHRDVTSPFSTRSRIG
jgi:hypothetical protein